MGFAPTQCIEYIATRDRATLSRTKGKGKHAICTNTAKTTFIQSHHHGMHTYFSIYCKQKQVKLDGKG